MNQIFIRSERQFHIEMLEDRTFYWMEPFDQQEQAMPWGRIRLLFSRAEKEREEPVFRVYARELDGEREEAMRYRAFLQGDASPLDKLLFFGEMVSEHSDFILYEKKKRWLFLAVELNAPFALEMVRIDHPGDQFMQTFPAVFQDENSFFHRYLSIFSSIYEDLNEEKARLPQMLRIDDAPKELLPMLARFLGLDVDIELFDEALLRRLLKLAPMLNKRKGSVFAIREIVKAVTGESCTIREYTQETYRKQKTAGQTGREPDRRVYAKLLFSRTPNEKELMQLRELFDLYQSILCPIQIESMDGEGRLDEATYLDEELALAGEKQGILDTGARMDQLETM